MSESVKISDIAVKRLSQPDADGEISFAVKATVRNCGNEVIEVIFNLQGLDEEDFEIFSMHLSGDVAPNESKVFTSRETIPLQEFEQIVRWQVS